MLPRIAIVGRPNVGKSSLFNRLAGRRVSIVDPTPGTTRDRIEATVELLPPRPVETPGARRRAERAARKGRKRRRADDDADALEDDTEDGDERRTARDAPSGIFVDLVDTGGWGVYVAEGKRIDDAGKDLAALTPDIEAQILSAARSADLILFVFDARTGPIALDQRVVELMRREKLVERVVAVANKVDDISVETDVADLAKFGFGVPLPVSAKSGRGLAKLRELLREHAERINAARGVSRSDAADANEAKRERARRAAAAAKAAPHARDTSDADDVDAVNGETGENGAGEAPPLLNLEIAIVGRRNAGKSSLVNALAGEPRVIVSEIAGTTRDSIDVRFEIDGRVLTAIDTAGVRKRKSWDGDIEYYANLRVQESIRRAGVCVLLLDAVEKVSQVEKNLAMQLTEAYKPTVIAVNKWDLVSRTLKSGDYIDYLGQELPGLAYAPIAFVSAKSGRGLRDLVAMCFNLAEQARHRETTGRVNAAMGRILKERGPSSKLGTKAKLFYVSQIDVAPPTLAMVVNKPELFEGAYARYLENRLRDELPFSEVPIRLIFSARKREEWGGGGGAGRSDDRRASSGSGKRGDSRASSARSTSRAVGAGAATRGDDKRAPRRKSGARRGR